ncbi:iron-containing redox enzyme family protein [Microbispora sp. H10885]|uniref:iron-containing redox enzyme family protein n=1 Tax=Microbispora sp. H10885 TaxID=2729110 RepID=UPI0021758B25|nr:iron-containing redox enzyme family protein [Microbispora sp. H10885]
MLLPAPRGPITDRLRGELARPPHLFDPPPDEAYGDEEDLHLALFVCYELHYQGFDGVDDRWEWHPSVLALRERLERCFEAELARLVPRPPAPAPEEVPRALAALVAADQGPSLSAYLRTRADLGRFAEFVVHRSVYQLKEADPHTWGIPRLLGRSKAALVEIQADEYGGGVPERMHAEMFRATMRALGLDDSYGAYLDSVPGATLAVSNVMSLFGLHRRHRGALLGHLAAFEMTSSTPNRRYSQGLRRLGGDAAARRYFEEHVQADAVHEQIAAHDMCGAFAAEHPGLTGDILFGAACALALDRIFAERLLGRWRAGRSSLLRPLASLSEARPGRPPQDLLGSPLGTPLRSPPPQRLAQSQAGRPAPRPPEPEAESEPVPAPPIDYVLPLRWQDDSDLAELTGYLRRLSRHARIVVVDGSPSPLFERHARLWREIAEHLRPDDDVDVANGKVAGVLTGMRRARNEHVIIADDDVRYEIAALGRVSALLKNADLVRPQNHFHPLPWHARWDSARTLLNRGLGADYPGTFGVRRSFFARMGGYDGDVLFENLELIRTVRAHGGREVCPLDLYVRRLPPGTRRFWSQRVRQAYDDLAQPARMAVFLAVLPAVGAALRRRRPALVAAGAAAVAGLAEIGRRRAGGRRVFPATTPLFAPVWVLERATCSWAALTARVLFGGVPYAGRRLRVAAHSTRRLRRRATGPGPPHASP